MPMLKRWNRALLCALLLTGCATQPPADRSVPEKRSGDQQVKYHYALEAMKQGDLKGAEAQLLALTRKQPRLAGPWLNLCIVYSETGRQEAAQKACQQALQHNGAMNQARNQLGIVYRRMGRFQDARQIYQMALQQDPEYADVHYNLGVLFDLYLQDNRLAIQHYQRFLELTGNSDKKVKRWIAQLNKELNKSR